MEDEDNPHRDLHMQDGERALLHEFIRMTEAEQLALAISTSIHEMRGMGGPDDEALAIAASLDDMKGARREQGGSRAIDGTISDSAGPGCESGRWDYKEGGLDVAGSQHGEAGCQYGEAMQLENEETGTTNRCAEGDLDPVLSKIKEEAKDLKEKIELTAEEIEAERLYTEQLDRIIQEGLAAAGVDPNAKEEAEERLLDDDDTMTFEEALKMIKYPTGVLPGMERYARMKEEEEEEQRRSCANREMREEASKRNRTVSETSFTGVFDAKKARRRPRRVSVWRGDTDWGSPRADMWAALPDIVLEEILLYLSWHQRHMCSRVCKNWNFTFQSPVLWRHIHVKEGMFMKQHHKAFMDETKTVSKWRMQLCLNEIGCHLHSITMHPISSFNMMFDFMHILGAFLSFFDDYPAPLLDTFSFSFACEIRSGAGSLVLGTGGQILDKLKALLANFKGLRSLTLNQLRLDSQDCLNMLTGAKMHCQDSLHYLEVVNCTKERYPLYQVCHFPQLRRLAISPHQVNDDMVLLLCTSPVFEELILVQDQYTPPIQTLNSTTWLQVKQTRPDVKVRLEIRDQPQFPMLVQDRAPVHAVIYDSPHARVSAEEILRLAEEYGRSLRMFGHKQLLRSHGSKSFQERADTSLVLLIRECKNIETLVINERISTTTLLILATEAKKLKNMYVRKNAIIKKFDWNKAEHWTAEYYAWLKECSQSYERVQSEVSAVLGKPWYFLSDRSYMNLQL